MKFTTIFRNKKCDRYKESLFYLKLDNILYTVIIKDDITDYSIMNYTSFVLYKNMNISELCIINAGTSKIYLGIDEYLRLIKKAIINNTGMSIFNDRYSAYDRYQNYVNMTERHSKLKELLSII